MVRSTTETAHGWSRFHARWNGLSTAICLELLRAPLKFSELPTPQLASDGETNPIHRHCWHFGVINTVIKLRMRRMGAKKRPFYRIVAAEHSSPRDGRYIEVVGTYNPLVDPAEVTLKEDRIKHFLDHGAK